MLKRIVTILDIYCKFILYLSYIFCSQSPALTIHESHHHYSALVKKKILQFSILLQIYITFIAYFLLTTRFFRSKNLWVTPLLFNIFDWEMLQFSILSQIYIRIIIYFLLTTNSSALTAYESCNYSAFVRIEWNVIWFSILLQICIHIYYKINISRENIKIWND